MQHLLRFCPFCTGVFFSGRKGEMFAKTIVAEGVETEEQTGFLCSMECHMGQGFCMPSR